MNKRIAELQKMLEAEPQDSFLNYALALEFANEHNFLKAISVLEALIRREPSYLAAYYQLGKFYEKEDDTSNAALAYRNGIEIARQQKNHKTLGELRTALLLLED